VFGRRRSANDRDVAKGASADLSAEAAGEDLEAAPDGKVSGPWDAADGFPAMERVDLGSLQIPVLPGVDIQLVFAEQHGAWVTARYGENEMQLQAFAAPKSGALWDEVRGEIAAELGGAGGTCEERIGPFGTELLASVPAEPGQPRAGMRPVRFAGVNGPRWFLRALFAGDAAVDPGAAAPLEALMREVVVVRGDHPMPPREMLELRLPPDAAKALEEQARAQQAQQENRFSQAPDPFERGPEITETR
jgi:Protein of unknown function (DUF3710)